MLHIKIPKNFYSLENTKGGGEFFRDKRSTVKLTLAKKRPSKILGNGRQKNAGCGDEGGRQF